MDFWGIEVKSGMPFPVLPREGKIVHLSQACLGKVKKDKGNEPVYIYVIVDGKKLVLATLSPEKFPQQQFDLVFDEYFELSHSWKNGSVYFYGYRCDNPFDETDDESAVNIKTAKQGRASAKQKGKIVEPKQDVRTAKEDSSSDETTDSDSSQHEVEITEDEDDDSEDVESETEEDDDVEVEPPKKVESSKKRRAESAIETPAPDKKAKFVTPQKTDTKKGSGHVATPYPGKKAEKAPANKSAQQTPKSAGSHPCNSCNRSFNSENALQSHTKAKHSVGK